MLSLSRWNTIIFLMQIANNKHEQCVILSATYSAWMQYYLLKFLQLFLLGPTWRKPSRSCKEWARTEIVTTKMEETILKYHNILHNAKPGVENKSGLLSCTTCGTCAVKYHLIKSESPNLQVHFGWWLGPGPGPWETILGPKIHLTRGLLGCL